ncbi:MAG: nucleotidyl transferase AbiEii/AbiGii toxin family protein [Bacteroidota bacterium]
MTGLAPKTKEAFPSAVQLSCIKDYVLVGGTALAIQINHRLSVDLDFCKWIGTTSAKDGIDFRGIEEELKTKYKKVIPNPIDFNQADFIADGVKFQFFNEVSYRLPTKETIKSEGNLRIAPIDLIAAMKVKTMFQRTTFRDYYDVYAIVHEDHVALNKLIEVACTYDKKLNRGLIINRLTRHSSFHFEKEFGLLQPKYSITSEEIGAFFLRLSKL